MFSVSLGHIYFSIISDRRKNSSYLGPQIFSIISTPHLLYYIEPQIFSPISDRRYFLLSGATNIFFLSGATDMFSYLGATDIFSYLGVTDRFFLISSHRSFIAGRIHVYLSRPTDLLFPLKPLFFFLFILGPLLFSLMLDHIAFIPGIATALVIHAANNEIIYGSVNSIDGCRIDFQ